MALATQPGRTRCWRVQHLVAFVLNDQKAGRYTTVVETSCRDAWPACQKLVTLLSAKLFMLIVKPVHALRSFSNTATVSKHHRSDHRIKAALFASRSEAPPPTRFWRALTMQPRQTEYSRALRDRTLQVGFSS